MTALAASPGNAGTAALAEQFQLHDPVMPAQVAELARGWKADLVVIGPEDPLAAGAADAVRAAGIACLGPSASAARIESSKSFAKDVMAAAGVPTAPARLVRSASELDLALASSGPPYVVKDDGLARGKGVVVTSDVESARAHAARVLHSGRFVLLEKFLSGPELSLFSLVDGDHVRPLLAAQDFKRAYDNDRGPNTGGMGSYAPVPWVSPRLIDRMVRDIVQPVVGELARRGTPYSGLLYAGLAITEDGPHVLEFNCRFGDPETQSVLALLKTPLAQLLYATATGQLKEATELEWAAGAAVTVVLAAPGYPDAVRTGGVITGAEQHGVLHGGTRRGEDGRLHSSAGRVLSVVGTGVDLAAARAAAYERLSTIHLDGAQYRADIALRAARGDGPRGIDDEPQ